MFDRIEAPPSIPLYPSTQHAAGPSSQPSSHCGRQSTHDPGSARIQHTNFSLRVPPAPALAVEVSGVGSRFTNSAPSGGGGSGSGLASREAPVAQSSRQSGFVQAHQPRGDGHPRSVIPHARGTADRWGTASGGGGNGAPPYSHRGPPGPMGAYPPGPGAGAIAGAVASEHGSAIPTGVIRGDQGHVGGSGGSGPRSSWALTSRKDGHIATVSSAAGEMVGVENGGATTGSPRMGAVRAYPGVRFDSQQQARWRNDNSHDSPAAGAAVAEAVAADATASTRNNVSRQTHWGNPGGGANIRR